MTMEASFRNPRPRACLVEVEAGTLKDFRRSPRKKNPEQLKTPKETLEPESPKGTKS